MTLVIETQPLSDLADSIVRVLDFCVVPAHNNRAGLYLNRTGLRLQNLPLGSSLHVIKNVVSMMKPAPASWLFSTITNYQGIYKLSNFREHIEHIDSMKIVLTVTIVRVSFGVKIGLSEFLPIFFCTFMRSIFWK